MLFIQLLKLHCGVKIPLEIIRGRIDVRIDVQHFDTLLGNITPLIQKEDRVMKEAITAKTKLQTALCYLVTGASYHYLQASYRVSRAAISSLIPEVMDAIFTCLENYLKVRTFFLHSKNKTRVNLLLFY